MSRNREDRVWIILSILSAAIIILIPLLMSACDKITGSWKVDVEEKEDGGGTVEVTPIKPKKFELVIRDIHHRPIPYTGNFEYWKYGFEVKNQIWTGWNFKWPSFDEAGNPVNGGLPQNIDWNAQFTNMERTFPTQCPNVDFDGYCVIDFETYVPVLPRDKPIYRTKSIEKVLADHPELSKDDPRVTQLAEQEFFDATIEMLVRTLQKAKELRPKGKWGYYGYPARCYYAGTNTPGYSLGNKLLNNKYQRIWEVSDVIYPSLYVVANYESRTEDKLEWNKVWAEQNVREALRVANGKPVICYTWYQYTYGELMLEADYRLQVESALKYGANGTILWMHNYSDAELKRIGGFFENVGGPVHTSLGLIK